MVNLQKIFILSIIYLSACFFSFFSRKLSADEANVFLKPTEGQFVLKGVVCKYGELADSSIRNWQAYDWNEIIREESKTRPIIAVWNPQSQIFAQEDLFANLLAHLSMDSDCRISSTAHLEFLDGGKLKIKTSTWGFSGSCSVWSFEELCQRTVGGEWLNSGRDMCDYNADYMKEIADRCDHLKVLTSDDGKILGLKNNPPTFERANYREVFSEYIWKPETKTLRLVMRNYFGDCVNQPDSVEKDSNRNNLALEFEMH